MSRARAHVGTVVAEMEAGVHRERGATVLSDTLDDAPNFENEIETFHTANESIELHNMRRTRTF
ncbi:hypothetical protein AURDEDRAFT_155186 [Auricularia subglabra TFB-10046 SS5]|nr:hypothetical protein AURDEDRAFT_155186 [Auricularia subglabra TFB-10046 SS5]